MPDLTGIQPAWPWKREIAFTDRADENAPSNIVMRGVIIYDSRYAVIKGKGGKATEYQKLAELGGLTERS